MFGKGKEELKEVVSETIERLFNTYLNNTRSLMGKLKQVKELEEQIQKLGLEKSKREWEFEKREMAVEHKVGLERKRQEFEIEQAKREALVSVREANLQADRDRFEGQMEFHEERFAKEVGYLKDMIQSLMERFPMGKDNSDAK